MLLTVLLNLSAIGALAGLAYWANRMIKARQARDRAAVIAQIRNRAPVPQLSKEEVAYGLALAMGSLKSGNLGLTLPAEAPRFVRDDSALMQPDALGERDWEMDPAEEVHTYRYLGGSVQHTGKRALTAEERAVLC